VPSLILRAGARADGALGQIVVGGQAGHAHELEERALVAQQAVAEGVAGVALVGDAGMAQAARVGAVFQLGTAPRVAPVSGGPYR